MDENVMPSENLHCQNVNVKVCMETTGSMNRSPFKELGNTELKARNNKSVLKNAVTPSKYVGISELDEEMSWRERTEVVTAIEHDAYTGYAKEMLNDVINKIEEYSGVEEGKLLHPAVAEFRASPVVGDSDSEYESAGELEDTALVQTLPSPSVVLPNANSTMLNVTCANNTPNRLKTGMENTLLNSFENMKLHETYDNGDEENFHDASDIIENKSHGTPPDHVSTSIVPSPHDSTFEQLTLSFGKVSVTDVTQELQHSIVSTECGENCASLIDDNFAGSSSKTSEAKEETGEASNTPETSKSIGDEKYEERNSLANDDYQIESKTSQNLEYLDKINQSNFDPCSAMTSVATLPDKDQLDTGSASTKEAEVEHMDERNICEVSLKNIVQEAVEVSVLKCGDGDESGERGDTLTTENDMQLEDKNQKESENKDFTLKGQNEATGIHVLKEEEGILSKKSCNTDSLEVLYVPVSDPCIPKPVSTSSENDENIEAATEKQIFEVSNCPNVSEIVNVNHIDGNRDKAFLNPTSGKPSDDNFVDIQDELIPPKKEYNLEFLENVDDPSFDPFATRTAVNNSPAKAEQNALVVSKETELAKESRTQEIEEEGTLRTSGKPSDDNIADTQEELIPPKKEYNLEFLENVDDPSFDPFATRTAVNNSPAKAEENALVVSKESRTQEIKEEKETISSWKDLAQKGMSDIAVIEDHEKEQLETVEDVEIRRNEEEDMNEIIPTKGYNLDFLENMEDPTFNPFDTKTGVKNSPDRKDHQNLADIDLRNLSTEEMKNSVPEVKLIEKAMEDNWENSDNIDVDRDINSTVGMIREVLDKQAKPEEQIALPKKGYNLDFLENLDDSNFNPFKTKTNVSNSPDKKNSPDFEGQKVEEKSSEISNEKNSHQKENIFEFGTQKVEEEKSFEISKPDNRTKVKEVKRSLGSKKKIVKSPEDMTAEDQMEKDNPPKGQYNLEFLENLDNVNFNPFSAKITVNNSPVKNEKLESEKEAESADKKRENAHTKVAHETLETEGEADKPKGISQLDVDNINDPDFNPFVSKASLLNSPDKRDAAESIVPTSEREDCNDAQASSLEASVKLDMATAAKITKSEFATSLGSIDFDQISKEAIKLASQVTSKPQTPEEQKGSETSQPRDVFSPLPSKQSQQQDNFGGAFGPEEFSSATDFSGGDQEPLEEENFQDATCYPIFNNPEDFDVLGSYGTEGNKINLVRNSLYVKFDPLVSGRQSLAPYLAQQLYGTKEEQDSRRCSGLISFSPSPIKAQRQKDTSGTPVRAQVSSRADETLMLDSTALDNTAVIDNSNMSIMSNGQNHNSTVIANVTTESASETVLQLPIMNTEKMVPERVMNERLKNLELSMQDTLLRKIRTFEEEQKKSKQQIEEQNIALTGMEEENSTLKATIVKMQDVLAKIMKQEEVKEKERKTQLLLLENQYESKIAALQKESQQYQDELKNAEAPFFDLVKKFERLREVTECLRRNEESLKSENEGLKTKLTQKEETFKNVLQTLEENYGKAQEEFSQEKEKHEKELGKASVMLKRAEVKILSLSSSLEEKTADNRRLAALLDDITNKFG